MKSTPLVTVLMPVYNCQLYIREAIESILNQTYVNFELLIIDDASTDETVAIIKSYEDARINLVVKPENSGLTKSLNYGLSLAKGEYIARMDGDDISLPNRLAVQIEYLEKNKEVALCGTQYKVIGREKYSNHPCSYEDLKVNLLEECYIAHPTVVFRTAFVKTHKVNYSEKFDFIEDYELWSRLIFLGKIVNIDQVLVHYRVHENQISSTRYNIQLEKKKEIILSMFRRLYPSLPEVFVEEYMGLKEVSTANLHDEVMNRLNIIANISKINDSNEVFKKCDFKVMMLKKKSSIFKIIMNYSDRNFLFCIKFLLKKPVLLFQIPLKTSVRLILKSIVKN